MNLATSTETKRLRWRTVEGLLILDKPLGMSSNQALQRVRRLFQAQKAGHGGSLDPLASGWLPICFGKATRWTTQWLNASKHYHVVCQLGARTLCGDAEGEVIDRKDVTDAMWQQLETVLASFVGVQEQIPSMYSALKHQGKPLYEWARQGIDIERPARTIEIFSIAEVEMDRDHQRVSFQVHSSKGTYIRTLVEDLGARLGCGAYVLGLRRTGISDLPTDKIYAIDDLERIAEQQGLSALDALLWAGTMEQTTQR